LKRTVSRTSGSINPLRILAQRVSFLTCLALSIALLIFSRADPGLTGRVQGALMDIAAPVVEFLGRPVVAAREFGGRLGDLMETSERLDALREDNRRLQQWRDTALRLDAENAQLRALMQVKHDLNIPAATARVVSEPGGPFLRAVIIDAGRGQGIARHQPVVDETGLIGRVVTTGRNTSRALLVTDLNSRVPVTIERTGERAILAGDNSARPRLSFLPIDADVRLGDRVVTSGDGGVFPPRIVVGAVDFVEGSIVRVKLASDLSQLDFVNVLAYTPPPPPSEEAEQADGQGAPGGPAVAADAPGGD